MRTTKPRILAQWASRFRFWQDQGTLSQWHERRIAETPQRAELPFARIAGGLSLLEKRGAAYCFIDTAPAISEQTTMIINLADLVLVPVRPSPADLWAVSQTVELIHQAGKPFLFVITQAKPQALIYCTGCCRALSPRAGSSIFHR